MVVPSFDTEAGSARPLRRAAQYVRMSTEHQKYSTENQAQIIEEYALRRGLEVVRTYADAGKSGLRLDGRDSLQQLLSDVQTGAADFTDILVYDVSRWGRFQDADQSAYYEFVCRRAGVAVHYCAEQSRMTARSAPASSRPSNAPWRASIAASYPPRCSPASAA